MLHFIIGTKAQFIKMMPLMHLLESERRPYHLLDLGQHASITARIVKDFGLSPDTTSLSGEADDVDSYLKGVGWLARGFSQLCRPRSQLLRRYFQDSRGVSLIHGDTASTLLGLHLGRRAGMRVGLVEAGLTSGHAFDPFPEELIRRHAERNADLLFPPDARGEQRLRALKLRGAVHRTAYNTGRDALMLTIKQHGLDAPPADLRPYSVMTLHRLETLSRRNTLAQVIDYAVRLSDRIGPVRFYLHAPTENALLRSGLMERLKTHPNFQLAPLLPYPAFVRELLHCRYLLTDGGSIQEEASYLEKPCLILRRRTERSEGLDGNARLASYDMDVDWDFLQQAARRSAQVRLDFSLTASRQILEVASAA